MSIFRDDDGCLRPWVYVVIGLLLCVFIFGIPLLLGAPWKGCEEKIYYTIGEDSCVIERVDHCLFFDDKTINVCSVVEFGGKYFYVAETPGVSCTGGRYVEFDISEVAGQ